jgi:hypothetical protein
MNRLGICLALVALCGVARGDDSDGEALGKKILDSFGKIVKTMEEIKDKASAEKVKPELEKLFADVEKTSQSLSKLSPEERKKLEETLKPKVMDLGKSFNKEMERLRKDEAVMKVLSDVGPFKALARAKEVAARAKAAMIETALQAYKSAKDQYPASLEDLAQGDKPFIKAEDLKDPWGKMYMFDASGPKNMGLKPDVWTVDPDGKTIGNWLDRPAPPKDKVDKDGPGKDKPTDKPAKDK